MIQHPLRLPTIGVSVDRAGCDVDDLVYCAAVQVRVGGDEAWESVVDRAVSSGWIGVEALAGVPGTVAEVTRRNAAAFGQAVADTAVAVRTWDRQADAQRTFAMVDCDFRPGGSRFQQTLDDGSLRYDILDVAFLFKQGDLSAPVSDQALAEALGAEVGLRVPLARVRDTARQQGRDPLRSR